MGTSKPSVVETNVSQSAGSKASLAVVGLMAWASSIHLHAQDGVLDRGLVFLREVKLALLLETRACVALTQSLEGRPMLGELLRDKALGRDDGLWGLLGLLVLRVGVC